MRLLHITATHLNSDGGIPVVLKNLVIEQNKIESFSSRVISLTAPVNNMDCSYFEYVKRNEFQKYLDMYNPDIAILHSFYYISYNYVSYVLYKRHIKYYIEPHGAFGKAALRKSKLKKIIANNTIFRNQIKRAYGFIFLNEAEKEDAFYQTSKDIIIPNGIPKNLLESKIIDRNFVCFYFIGRYNINHKGLDYLLDALEILEKKEYGIKIALWGKGDKDIIRYIKSRAEQFKYIQIEINSSIYGEDKNNVLEQMGPMILTSRYEGFPMTVLEAWSYGNPCLVTPGTNVSNEVEKYNLGWTVELEANKIAKAILVAQKDYIIHRQDYIKRCKKHVKDNYLWENIAKKSFLKLMNN